MSSMGFPTENLTDGLVYEKWQYNATTGQWEIIPVQVSPAPPVWTELPNDDIKRNSQVGIGKTPNASLDVQTESNSVGLRLGLDVAPDRDLIVSSYAVETTNAAGWDFNASDASHGTISFSTLGNKRLTIDHTGTATFSQGVFGKFFGLASSHYMEKVGDNMAFVASSGGTMTFATGDTGPKLTIDSTGNVGIGTSSPSQSLEVLGELKITGPQSGPGSASGFLFGIDITQGYVGKVRLTDVGFEFDTGTNTRGYLFNGGGDATFSGTVNATAAVTTGETNLKWGTASKLRVASDGLHFDDWIRSSTSGKGWYHNAGGGGWMMSDTTWIRAYGSKAVYVANQIAATGDVTAFYSDERLKEKVGTIDNALEAVQSIETFLYKHNDIAREHGYDDDKVHAGVSAQSVERVLPEIVDLAPFDYETLEDGTVISKSGEDYKTVKYEKLTVLLIEAIKEQQTQINELKERLEK